jgi:hypothetical protein
MCGLVIKTGGFEQSMVMILQNFEATDNASHRKFVPDWRYAKSYRYKRHLARSNWFLLMPERGLGVPESSGLETDLVTLNGLAISAS